MTDKPQDISGYTAAHTDRAEQVTFLGQRLLRTSHCLPGQTPSELKFPSSSVASENSATVPSPGTT